MPKNPTMSRYYIQKKTPFFINGERYFEITLQLAGLYATKFNRITVYTKQNISTNYSIQIAYENADINLWGIKSKIMVISLSLHRQLTEIAFFKPLFAKKYITISQMNISPIGSSRKRRNRSPFFLKNRNLNNSSKDSSQECQNRTPSF